MIIIKIIDIFLYGGAMINTVIKYAWDRVTRMNDLPGNPCCTEENIFEICN